MTYYGNGISPGIAAGKAYVYKPYVPGVKSERITAEEAGAARAEYLAAVESARLELEAGYGRLKDAEPDKAKIFEAHLEILLDEAVGEEIDELISEEFFSASMAVDTAYERFCALLARSKDTRIAERQSDVRDVKNRLLRCIDKIEAGDIASLAGPVVIIARDLFPSDTAAMDRAKVLGIVTELGGPTSHTAIIAKSWGIPAISGITDAPELIKDGEELIVDADGGLVICGPDAGESARYAEKRRLWQARLAAEREFAGKPCRTKDGLNVGIGLNIGSADAGELEQVKDFDFVGLFRTEFLYMGKEHMPEEEEQFEAYRRVMLACGDKPVTLRTLDIGGDKTLSYMPLPREDNPFLGVRALRLCFNRPELFRTQLRAALRASAYGNLWLMLPMVASLEDIRRAKRIISDTEEALRAEGKPVSRDYKLGIMVEIPSIAVVADKAAEEVDFASIGTNDLCQYLTAADRGNPQVADYYQNYHPAMLRVMRRVIEEFARRGKSVGVCGELGGDPLAAPVLVGFGIDKLSMSAASAPGVKRSVAMYTSEQLREIAGEAAGMSCQEEVLDYLRARFAR